MQRRIGWLAIAVLAVSACAVHEPPNLSQRALWRFTEPSVPGSVISDLSGNGHHAVQVDGFVSVPSDAGFTAGPLSVEVWFRTSSATTGHYGYLISQGVFDADGVFDIAGGTISFAQSGADGTLIVTLIDGGGVVGSTVLGSDLPIDDGGLHQAVLTVSSSGAAVLYLDGVNNSTGTRALTALEPRSVSVGGLTGLTGDAGLFQGTISKVAFYDTALTVAQVTALYVGR